MAKGKRKNIVKYSIIILFSIFVIMQFFNPEQKYPEIEPSKDFFAITNPPADIKKMIKSACYDCHSYKTKYPWYSGIAPVSWIVADHIEEAREHLNFSTWADYDEDKANHKLHECEEEVENKEMPLTGYTYLHSEADLSDVQREKLADWFKSTMTGPDKGHDHEEQGEHEH